MKHINISLIVILFLSLTSQAQVSVESEVKEAIIFSNQAQLTRVQNVKLEKGMNIVKFTDMESSVVANSLQVSATGSDVTVVSNNFANENVKKSMYSIRILSLMDSLEYWKRTEQLSIKKVQNLQAEKNAILYNKSANGVNSGFNLDNMSDLADYYRNNLDLLDEKIYDQSIYTAHAKVKKYEFSTELTKEGFKTRNNVLKLEVISDRAQTVPMRLVYVINNVSWTPFYEIKGSSNEDNLTAICKAKIYQNSTIDWKNVKLTLSTSQPLNNGVLPTVHPWILRYERRMQKSLSVSNRVDNAYSNKKEQSASSGWSYGSTAKSMANYTTATENMVSREFNVSLPYSIIGKNGMAVVELEKFTLPANYLYYAAPKYSCDVFLIAQVTDWEQYNLLPGVANLFMEGNFVGTSLINPNSVSDTMRLVLGKDESIIVKREKIKDLSKRSVLGGSKRVNMGIQISVKNTKSKDIEIMIEDQVPVSGDASIEIEYKDISGAKKDEETGKLTWQYTLKPGKTEVHKITYQVKHPKNKAIPNF